MQRLIRERYQVFGLLLDERNSVEIDVKSARLKKLGSYFRIEVN